MRILAHSPWVLIESGLGAPAFNMALDEALLEHACSASLPVLRFYGWSEPAATFGYFQKYEDVAAWTQLRPLIRRPTGGGLVPHDKDWTYSVIIPPGHPWYELKAIQSYQFVHEWLRQAFENCGLTTVLAPAPQKEGIGQCFIGAEQHDLLWQAKKIAGAAQRRNKHGLLIQGSVQEQPSTVSRKNWEAAMLDSLQVRPPSELPAEIIDRAEETAREKYSTAAYNQKR
jgi:lipoate-protein ligase A